MCGADRIRQPFSATGLPPSHFSTSRKKRRLIFVDAAAQVLLNSRDQCDLSLSAENDVIGMMTLG